MFLCAYIYQLTGDEGGGAGRIRINTFTGIETPGGITPTVGSELATVGKIRVD